MIARQLKLRPTKAQEARLEEWLWQLTGLYNWAIRKIELDARDGIFHSRFDMINLISGHSQRMSIPSKVLAATVTDAWRAWDRCFKKLSKRPRLKGRRNRLTSIPCQYPVRIVDPTHVTFPLIGQFRFHKQALPDGNIKQVRIQKQASGWYLTLFIDGEPQPINLIESGVVGIDLGYSTLATLSTGEKIAHPHELQQAAHRYAQAQRGRRKQLASRLRERDANRRRDRNHKLSRKLVAENETIVISKDHIKGLARVGFGKSVGAASHGELRKMLAYKCTTSGRRYIEVSPKDSTRTCSSCRRLTGPTGWAGLKVRHWECSACGAEHDRDVNAAINTLNAGLGSSLELAGNRKSGT